MKYKIALIVLALLVAALFISSSLFFTRSAKTLDTLARSAVLKAEEKDLDGTKEALRKLRTAFDSQKWTFKLLLDHEEVDKLEIALTKAERALSLEEETDVLYALDELLIIAQYIGQIELPLLTNIL